MHIPGRHSYFTHIYDGDTYIRLLGMLASSLTASSAEIKAATEKRIEPSTKSSSPIDRRAQTRVVLVVGISTR